MESWREVWRTGFARVLPMEGLESLLQALKDDDKRLIQGNTTHPPPLMCVQDWPTEKCCVLGWTRFCGDDSVTVGEVEEHFAKMCFEADQILGEPAACRWFLNWYDDTPRDEMRQVMIEEVELAIAKRTAAMGVSCDER